MYGLVMIDKAAKSQVFAIMPDFRLVAMVILQLAGWWLLAAGIITDSQESVNKTVSGAIFIFGSAIWYGLHRIAATIRWSAIIRDLRIVNCASCNHPYQVHNTIHHARVCPRCGK